MMNIFNNTLVAFIVAFAIALALFYVIDIGVMSIQGLPLNANLTPAQ